MRSLGLNGKSLVVIGGTSGIGLSAARAFVSAGAKVVVVGRDPEKVKSAQDLLGPNAIVLSGDAANSRTSDKAVETAVQKFGALHGLFHVAGGSGRKLGDGPLHSLTDEAWGATLEWNLSSVIYSNRAAVRQFLAQNTAGSILNLGSVLGWSPAPHYFATHAYATAKAAIIGFTKSIAAYYAPKSIRCNVLATALVETPMSQRAVGNPAIMNYIKTKQPLDAGRVGQPADIDAAALFFMSDDSRFVTGQVLAIDGGWCVSEGRIPD